MALATSVIQPLSPANCCLNSSSSSKPTPNSFLSLPSKPLRHFLLFASHFSSSPSSKNLPLWRRSLIASVAQTSDWAPRQDEDEESGFDWEGDEQQVGEGEGEDAEGGEAGSLEWDGEGEEGESGDEGDDVQDSYLPPPEEAKLFVGNLPYDVDSTGLATLFDQAGIVESAEVIYNRETDQSRGFGFVVMSTVEEAEKAVEMFHRYEFNGRSLNVNKAAPRGVRSERSPQVFGSSFRMYVGNIPWQVDDARLEQVFSEHGKVVDARVVYDRETGRSRGFGFVTMSSKTEMDDAIAALDGKSLDGRAIRVNVAEERPRRGIF